MNTVISHIDCNNFYASCERLFDPTIQKSPVVVLSNNDGNIVARSNEAKSLGIKQGTPLFQNQGVIEKNAVTVFSSNYSLYGDLSARVMSELETYSNDSEIYSIDEAFLEFPDLGGPALNERGWEIKEAIKRKIGIPVSVGFGETKTLAKLANRLAKKSARANGVLNLYQSPHLPLALERTPIEDVWGIGAASSDKLKKQRIENAWQFRNLDVRFVRKLLTVTGARVALELRGVKCIPLEQVAVKKRNIAATRSFGESVFDLKHLKEAVAYFLSLAVEKLRKNDLSARSVNVFVSGNRFKSDYYSNSAGFSSVYASNVLLEIQTWAFSCLNRIYQSGVEYKRGGIILSGLMPASSAALRMLDDNFKLEKLKALQNCLDEINHRWGKGTVRFACNNPAGKWQMKQLRKSPRYTTRLDEIMTIN